MRIKYIYLFVLLLATGTLRAQRSVPLPPGTVIDHIPSSAKRYIGSPSICMLPNGDYVASHDEFGPASMEHQSAVTTIFTSTDKGNSWIKIARIDGQFWSNLFYLNSALYLMGTNKSHGNVIIRRSIDGGKTWTVPYNKQTGLLLEGEYHTAPTPICIHNGRIWRGVEYATAPNTKWGERYSALMISAQADADLLNADNWTRTNHLYYDSSYLNGNFRAWLEGNAVALPSGEMADILRVEVPGGHKEMMALVRASASGDSVSFNPSDFYEMPGAGKKFTIRYDVATKRYWSLVNEVPDSLSTLYPGAVRNVLTLVSSRNLKKWKKHKVILYHPDYSRHGFHYVDWLFEGDDIIFVSRTAYDDNTGGAKNNHDSNFITFHRIKDFRKLKANG